MIHVNNRKVLYVLVPLVYLLALVISVGFSYIFNARFYNLEYISFKRVLFIACFLMVFFNLMLVKVFEHHRDILIKTIIGFFFIILIGNIAYSVYTMFGNNYSPLYLSTQDWQSRDQNEFTELQQVNAFITLFANAAVFAVNYIVAKYFIKLFHRKETIIKNG